MIKINVIDTYKVASEECAYFVFDSEWVQDGYQRHIKNGEDPREHIFYNAAVILDKTENFQNDIEEYLKTTTLVQSDRYDIT